MPQRHAPVGWAQAGREQAAAALAGREQAAAALAGQVQGEAVQGEAAGSRGVQGCRPKLVITPLPNS